MDGSPRKFLNSEKINNLGFKPEVSLKAGLIKTYQDYIKGNANFKKIFNLLTSYEKKNALLLIIMIIITALLDMIGVVSILPFMAVLSNPSLIETNIFLNKMFQTSLKIGVENNQQFLFALGVISFLMLVTSLVFKALANYIQIRFVQMLQ